MKQISEDAFIDSRAFAEDNVVIWHRSQIREFARIGSGSILGNSVYIGTGVQIGKNCKIQNNSLIYEPATIENGVFIGPGTIFTNDRYPRAVNPDLSLKTKSDWIPVGVTVKEGASIGAGTICVAPVEIGAWSLVAAGSVVIRNVPDYAVVAGNPAKQIGWVGKAGFPLREETHGVFRCPASGELFLLTGEGTLEVN